MSSQQNVQIVQGIYEAFGRGEIQAIIDQLTDDVRWVSHFEPIVPWHGRFDGKNQVLRFFDAIGQSVDVLSFTPQELVADGEIVVSLGEFACRVHARGSRRRRAGHSSGACAAGRFTATSSSTIRRSPKPSGRERRNRRGPAR